MCESLDENIYNDTTRKIKGKKAEALRYRFS